MKTNKGLVLASLAVLVSLPAAAVTVLTFEGLQPNPLTNTIGQFEVGNYYNGSGPANLNLGIAFTGALGLVQAVEFGGPFGAVSQGFGQFLHQPPGTTVLTFNANPGVMTMMTSPSSGGFTSFSMNYAASDNVFIIPLDINGNRLFPQNDPNVLHLEDQGLTCSTSNFNASTNHCGVAQGTTPQTFKWASDGMSFGTVAYGLQFVGGFNNGGFDNLTLGSVTPGTVQSIANIPEPSTYAMMALGLLGIGIARRRQMR